MFLDIRLQHVQRETTVSRDNSTRRMESKSSGTVQGGIDDDEEPVLKYQRMGADVGKLLSTGSGFSNSMTSSDGLGDDGKRSSSNSVDREEVVRMAVHDSYLVFGTASGMVLVTDYHGNETRRLRPHTKAVTDLSMDITGDFVASCSEDGNVVVTGLQPGNAGEQTQPEVYSYGARWPMLAVRLDPFYARRKDKMFVAGGTAGKLLLNKKGWLGQDEIVLHKGQGAVSSIAWRGPLLAWASDAGIKVMDVDKGKGGERISFVDKPRSLIDFDQHACRCHLLWETATRLLVGWGDTVMVLQVLAREPRNQQRAPIGDAPNPHPHQKMPPSGSVTALTTPPAGLPVTVLGNPSSAAAAGLRESVPERYTQIVALWQSDCLLCGISPFDSNTLVLLGYPVEEPEDDDAEEEYGEEEDDRGVGNLRELRGGGWDGKGALFQPEVQLVKRSTGEVISADTLPLKGWQTANAGQLLLRSTCWSVSSHRPDKEGISFAFYTPEAAEAATVLRGLPPAAFIMSPRDIVVARVRDIDDKVSWALGKRDFLGAVNVALEQRHLLRRHDFQDLVARHLEDLMAKKDFQRAAEECPRLLDGDPTAWERWIYGFARRRRLSAVVPYVPIKNPRLPAPVYEVVLEHLLLTEPRLFLQTLRRWGHPRGKHGGQHGGLPTAGRIAERGAGGLRADAPTVQSETLHQQHQQQELYSLPILMARMEASLVRRPDPIVLEAQAEAYVMDRQFARAIRAYLTLAEHREASDDPGYPGAQNFGHERGDKLGAPSRGEDGDVQEGGQYAHVFRMIEQHSLFDTVQDRVLQMIRLDREMTGELLLRHPEKFSVSSVVAQLGGRRDLQHWYLGLLFDRSPEMYGSQEYAPFHALQVSLLAEFAPPFERGRPPSYNSAFLRFLRGSGFAPLEAALRECGKRRPPLYDEMAYILGRMGDTRRALTILLEEVGSVPRAIEFVESHDKDLWYRLIEHSLKNETFLSELLDHAGVYDVDLPRLVAEIPKGMYIPGLRDKLVKIISDYHFQVSVNESCNASVKTDLFRRLRRLNQGQRRATRVEPGARCSYGMCLMPLAGPPAGLVGMPATERVSAMSGRGWGRGKGRVARGRVKGRGEAGVRGSARRVGGLCVFPCGHMFHEYCIGVSLGGGWKGGGGVGEGVLECSLCNRGKSLGGR